MTTIVEKKTICTLINVFTVKPERQQELLDVLTEATEEVIKHLPGFISANFHKSVDGIRVANYAQWENPEALQAMLSHPIASQHIKKCQEIADHLDFHLYTVEHCYAAGNKAVSSPVIS
jgi:quinol monooxygenase YgiN